ncbi:MAG: hypothetical protein GTN82_01730, partial [Candidatus Aminicenantes bacterium]|nr:hypothetical protein [Candidatus Aminicenantes bacterium]NIN16779.1 hypothetical protein [Candidatus Aminicenantes bacterium]NIR04128.1 hypothetical protein [Candidatus Aminicenantes bacterium]NIT23594.1 hypothetical protein [Candidatus Aminicenantes bacterium]
NIYVKGQIPPTNTQEIFEDFSVCNSDWVEYDPENKIELDCTNDHRLEFNHWIRYEPGYVYRPFSTTDFVLEYDINITDHGGNGNVVGPGFSDTLGATSTTQNGIFSVFYAGWPGGGGVPHLDLHIYENGTQVLDWTQFLDLRISTGTTYYLRVEKSGGNVTFSIFSNASRTSHISGSPKTFTTNLTNTTFNYFYAINGPHTSPQGNWEWTSGWIDNIYVRKEQIPGGDCINVGNLTLCADSISQSGNIYTLSGNVNINKNLWFSGDVTYTGNSTTTGTLICTGYPYVKLSDGNHPLFTAVDIKYNVDGVAGTLVPSNLNITNYELSLGNIPLIVTSDPIIVKNNGVLIGGRIVIGSEDSTLCGVDVEVLYKTGDKAYLQKAELSADISSTIPGIETASIKLNYDGEKDELTGTAKLDFPYLGIKEIEASIVVQAGCIDGFRISVALAQGIPLGSTGLQIVGLIMEVYNICNPPEFYIFFGGNVGVTGVPQDTFVLEGVGLGYAPPFILNIEGGTARFLGCSVASLSGHLDASGDPNETGAGIHGSVDFAGFYTAEINLKLLAMLLEFNGSAVGTLQIPDFDCDSFACKVIKTLIETLISLPYPVANQYMDIDVSCENGNCNGSLKGMVSIGNLEFAAALNYANNELNFSIGTNYEDMIQLSDSSQLRVMANSVEQPITFAANKEDVIFAAVGNTVQPQVYLNTPDGETITSSNVGNFSGVSYIESNNNLVTLFIL